MKSIINFFKNNNAVATTFLFVFAFVFGALYGGAVKNANCIANHGFTQPIELVVDDTTDHEDYEPYPDGNFLNFDQYSNYASIHYNFNGVIGLDENHDEVMEILDEMRAVQQRLDWLLGTEDRNRDELFNEASY